MAKRRDLRIKQMIDDYEERLKAACINTPRRKNLRNDSNVCRARALPQLLRATGDERRGRRSTTKRHKTKRRKTKRRKTETGEAWRAAAATATAATQSRHSPSCRRRRRRRRHNSNSNNRSSNGRGKHGAAAATTTTTTTLVMPALDLFDTTVLDQLPPLDRGASGTLCSLL